MRRTHQTLTLGLLMVAVLACEKLTTIVIPVSRVDLAPPSLTLVEGETAALTAVPKGPSGNTLYGRQVQWTVAPGTVASVSTNGRVSALQTGQATVQATVEGVVGSSSVTVLPGPEIALSRERVDLSAPEGQVSQSFDVGISNAGNGALTGLSVTVVYAGSQPDGWLNAGLNGTTAPTSLTLQAFAAGLTRGVYLATVTVESPVAGGLSATLLVAFTVEVPAPHLVLETDAVALSALLNGQQPAVQTIDITNGGGGDLTQLTSSVRYGDGQPSGWLQRFFSSTIAPSVLTLRAYPQGLAAGTYSAIVSVMSPDADNSPQDISVVFTVTPPGGSSLRPGGTAGALVASDLGGGVR